MTNWTANKRTLDAYHGQRKADANTRYVRYHSADDGARLSELSGVTEPVAVVLRGDGSVDVYGYIAIVDQRPCTGNPNPLYPRRTCSCGNAWADEPGHDDTITDVMVDEDIDAHGIPWRDRCSTEDPCPTRAMQGGLSCDHV